MSAEPATRSPPWSDAARAASLFAVDPVGTGGVSLRALPGPARNAWLDALRSLLPAGRPLRRVPVGVSDGRLLGGLDLAASLEAGRPVAEQGVLAESDGGVVVLAMAERLSLGTAARLALVLDAGEVALERDGFARRLPARFGVVALDEGIDAGEKPPSSLLDRLAMHVDLSGVAARDALGPDADAEAVATARDRLRAVRASAAVVEALSRAALALGIDSLRAPWLALRVARASAALSGRQEVGEEDCALAARLVLGPRATALPPTEVAPEPEVEGGPPDGAEPDLDDRGDAEPPEDLEGGSFAERIVEVARASVPTGLLEQLRLSGGGSRRSAAGAGAHQLAGLRGRPSGVQRGSPGAGARLDVVETLRAAAPWQRVRRRDARASSRDNGRPARVRVHREDFRVTRFQRRAETTAIFAVDASGSTALHRLAEAKGAVELLLSECYVRRDRVALLAFRGSSAELLLPPTRSLVRAKRCLAALPGGGATPLSAGIEGASRLADAVLRRGGTPLLILLTDGSANVARDGSPGRERAETDAIASARIVRAAGLGALLVDTAPRPQARARHLAHEMGARYLPLPHADADALCGAVREAR